MGVVSAVFAYKIVGVADVALDKASLLRELGIDPATRPELSQIVADDRYYALLERLADAETTPARLPLAAGAAMRCEDYGAFGMAWKAAPNLLGSFARAERYARLLTNVSTYEVVADEREVAIVLHRQGDRRGLRLSNEASLASVVTICREVSTRRVDPCAVQIRHAGPVDRAPYETFFGCEVSFSAGRNALVFDRSVVERPNRLGDEAMSRFFSALLDRELENVDPAEPIEALVRMQISRSLSAGLPRMTEVARAVGMSERTLHRRLADLGITYKTLAEQTRRQLAEGLLRQTRYSLAEVAFMTGFSEQSAFNRAFKRWEGRTPAAFRAAGGA